MVKFFLTTVLTWLTCRNKHCSSYLSLVTCASLLVFCQTGFSAELTPYSATYNSQSHHISVSLSQTLENTGEQTWTMSNHSDVLFSAIEESSVFELRNQTVFPLAYKYRNGLSDKRDSDLTFDWQQNTAMDTLQADKPLSLTDHTWDTLSFQTQLRLDIKNDPDGFTQKVFPQIVRGKIKHYTVTKVAEEVLDTPFGKMNTVKLKQQRPGKEKYTEIWLAKDWDYIILRLQRIEGNKVKYRIDLEELELGGRSLAAD